MNINSINVGRVGAINLKNNQTNSIKFKGNKDILDISDFARARNEILKKLQECGFDSIEALELYNEYSKTDEYNELINGSSDEWGTYPAHFIEEIYRNSTPEEAIVYQAFNMGDYYMQYGDFPSLPEDAKAGTQSSEERTKHLPSFLPLEFAKMQNKGYDAVLAGLILKQEIDEETAQRVKKYYDLSSVNYEETLNAPYCEENVQTLINKLDDFENWTSDETNEEGELLSGLTRPLTPEEAVKISDLLLDCDTDSINFYIWAKDVKEVSFGEIAIFHEIKEDLLKEYNGEILDKKDANIFYFPPNSIKVQTLNDKLDKFIYFMQSRGMDISPEAFEFIEDLRGLDTKKFFKRITLKTINFDVMSYDCGDRELRQKNIQALNGLSDAVLKKIRHFSTLNNLLKSPNLSTRVEELNKYAAEHPIEFEKFATRAFVLDTLGDTNLYSEIEKNTQEYKLIVKLCSQGITGEELLKVLNESGEIIDFPTKN